MTLLAFAGAWYAGSILDRPIAIEGDEAVFVIEPGSSFTRVAAALADDGQLDHPRLYRWYGRLTGKASAVQAGEYLIPAGATPKTLLEMFTSGEVRLHSFTLIEGWNHWELLDALARTDTLSHDLTVEDWPAYLESLGADVTYPEGLFLPETYRFPRGTTSRELLKDAYIAMQSVLAEEWQGRSAEAQVDSPYEALVLASIIEKETARADERRKISGVFTRRLIKRMRLQTDPTVIYGLEPTFDGNLTRKNLRTDTPYNTYTRRGLPPTPIAMPGRAAIHAALHPEEGDALFFVATGLDDGSHAFSATKDEHDAAVREYLQRLRARRQSDSE